MNLPCVGLACHGGMRCSCDDLVDHLGPADDFVVAGQRERPDLAGPMARHAAVLEDAGDLLRVGDVAVGLRRQDAADVAADRFGVRRGDFLAGEQFVEAPT